MAWITQKGERTAPSLNTSMPISEKGDLAAAALMAKVLARLWDNAEDYVGHTALSKTNHGLFEQIHNH
jgi:hypothetical protein